VDFPANAMSTLPQDKLDRLVSRWNELQHDLSKGPAQGPAQGAAMGNFAKLSKEFSDLTPLVETIESLRKADRERDDLKAMLNDGGADRDMQALAREELDEVGPRIEALVHTIRLQLLPKDAADERSVIVEVRAGTGGDEAALFASDLYRMYQRHADQHGWKTEIISASESDLGGFREIIATISGKGVYARLKYESGVHRVQRVPATEASGRIHTSAATVAVLPEAEEVDIEIRAQDIRIDTMRSSGAGGQHVNTTDSAVRLTHLPTGLVITSSEKSQHQNRARAMQVLRTRLYDLQRQKADDERAAQRKDQVGSGDRSQRIRTYNFPQGRVTDHRINLTLHKLDAVLEGGALDELIDALVTEHQASQLAAMDGGGPS
jgi:peptide chain release factor 1